MELETGRLILRRWRARDREPYAALTADPEVMQWLGGVLDKHDSAEHMDRCDAHFDPWGYGRWAIERRADGAFLGYCGLAGIWPGLPVEGVEIGWRLARHAWGQGYASEAARAAIADGFARFDFPEILAFTAEANARSRAVMARVGLAPDPARDFDHPQLPPGDPLRRHLVFAIRP
ncbi:GNAT family N-acetyltransferase [Caulobacter sp. KR2-114]|uniref:GNAT family N-acetyltransferase n=1 Tax=Caulobacter sp. KR2-114 TaxID=3400912 RepID=UPI003BFFC6ED